MSRFTEGDGIGIESSEPEPRMPAGARAELLRVLPERLQRIEEVVAPYLEALKSTGCITQFEALCKGHDPRWAHVKIDTDLTFRSPSVEVRRGHYATRFEDESRYFEFRGVPDVFTYDARNVRLTINRRAIYTAWRKILAEEFGHVPPGPERHQRIRQLLHDELLVDPRLSAASATFTYDFSIGNPLADRVSAQEDEYSDFLQNFEGQGGTMTYLLEATVRYQDGLWVLEAAGSLWSVPGGEPNERVPSATQWPLGEIADAIAEEYRQSWIPFERYVETGDIFGDDEEDDEVEAEA